MQNQPQSTPSQIETLAVEFYIFQPQTAQELQPMEECVETHAKQPEERITISQQKLWDLIIQNNVQQFTNAVDLDVLTTSSSTQTLQ